MDELQREIQELFSDLWQVPRFSGLRAGSGRNVDCYPHGGRDSPCSSSCRESMRRTVDIFVAEGTLYLSGERKRPRGDGQIVPADGARLRAVPQADRARRRTSTSSTRRPPTSRGILEIALPLTQRAPARARVVDRGHSLVTDQLVEPIVEKPDIPPVLPVLPLKETVVFPESMTPLAIGQERSIKLIDDVVAGERLLALVDDRERGGRDARASTISTTSGTAAIVHKLIRVPDGTLRILVQGIERIKLDARGRGRPVPRRRVLAAAGRARASRARSRR